MVILRVDVDPPMHALTPVLPSNGAQVRPAQQSSTLSQREPLDSVMQALRFSHLPSRQAILLALFGDPRNVVQQQSSLLAQLLPSPTQVAVPHRPPLQV